MKRLFSVALLVALPVSGHPRAAELKPAAAAAFDKYVRLTEKRIETDLRSAGSFLWPDTQPPARKKEIYGRLQGGDVVVERLHTRDGEESIEAPDGLIHHWVGVVFVPGASLEQAVALMQDYDRHSTYFAPAIARSRLLSRDGQRFVVALRFHVKKIITVTMDTENAAEFFLPAADRAHSRIRSTRVTEIADAGTPQERAKAPGDEHGFMWNLNTYWRFLARDGGTYIQCESLTLSRDVPFALAWIIRPIVTQMPRESLSFTLGRARDALKARQ